MYVCVCIYVYVYVCICAYVYGERVVPKETGSVVHGENNDTSFFDAVNHSVVPPDDLSNDRIGHFRDHMTRLGEVTKTLH